METCDKKLELGSTLDVCLEPCGNHGMGWNPLKLMTRRSGQSPHQIFGPRTLLYRSHKPLRVGNRWRARNMNPQSKAPLRPRTSYEGWTCLANRTLTFCSSSSFISAQVSPSFLYTESNLRGAWLDILETGSNWRFGRSSANPRGFRNRIMQAT
jgi:hypothetical protein